MELQDVIHRIRAADPACEGARGVACPRTAATREPTGRDKSRKQVDAWNAVIDKYLRPVEILAASPPQLMSLGESVHEFRREALAATFSLRNIADGEHRSPALRCSRFIGGAMSLASPSPCVLAR